VLTIGLIRPIPRHRHLTDAQTRALISALSHTHDENFAIHIVYVRGQSEAETYATDSSRVLSQAKIKSGGVITAPPNRGALPSANGTISLRGPTLSIPDDEWLENTGLTLFVRDLSHKPPVAAVFIDVLVGTGVSIKWAPDPFSIWRIGPGPGLQMIPHPRLLNDDESYLLVGLREPD
jgi:hypothetical protein